MKFCKYLVVIIFIFIIELVGKQAFAQLNKTYFFNQGRYYLSREEYTNAISSLNQLIRADSTAEEAWFLRGIAKYYLNDFQGSRSDFSKALAYNPVFSQAYLYRAIVLSRLSRYNQALADLEIAIDLRPNFSTAFFNRGITYLLINEPQKAISDFTRTILLEPKNVDAWINRGTARMMASDSLGALSDYNHAAILNPFYSESYSKRGRLYYELDDYHLALSDFSKAIDIDTSSSINYFFRALVNNKLERNNEALTDLNKTIFLNPDNALSLYNRGLIKWQIGSTNDALTDFNRVAELNPENVLIYFNRGVLLYELKKYQDAIHSFTKAITLLPDFAKAYSGRSAAYAMLGNDVESHRDHVFAQSIAEKFKNNHTQIWTDTTKKFDELVAFSSDFSPKTANPALIEFGSQPIDIKSFIKVVTVDKRNINNLFGLPKPIDEINGLLENTNIRFTLSTVYENDSSLVEFKTADNKINMLIEGINFSKKGKFSDAINAYKKVLITDPKNAIALLNLAVTEAEMANFIASFDKEMVALSFNQAVAVQTKDTKDDQVQPISYQESLETLEKLNPELQNHFAVMYNKGNIFALSGEMQKAINWYTMACKSEPDFAEAWYNRGLVYLMLKDTEKGCIDLGVAGEKGIKQAYLLIHRFCRL